MVKCVHCTFLVTCAARLVTSVKAGKEVRFAVVGIAVVIEEIMLADDDADVRFTGNFDGRVVGLVVVLVVAMIAFEDQDFQNKHSRCLKL